MLFQAEVYISQCEKQGIMGECIDFFVAGTQLAGMMGIGGNTFEAKKQGVLKAGNIFIFTADANLGTAGTTGS